jgi:sec-independent protein translocase protein TatA
MPSLGPAEILVILVVALLVFGPTKMPEMARQAGRAFREFRRVQQHLRSEISGAMSDLDVGAMGNPASTSAPEASDMMGGGDPVPMLPPKDATAPETSVDPPDPAPSSPPPADPT